MALLALAVVAFALVHLVPAVPRLRSALALRFGKAWGPAYGAAATLGLVAMILAWRAAPVEPVYEPPEWGRWAAIALMALAFMLLGVFLFRGRLRLFLRFPLAIAVVAWGAAHLLANGDLAAIVLFGGLAAYGLAHLALGWLNGVSPEGEPRAGHDVIAPVAGLALFIAMVQLHPVVIGVPVVVLP